MLSKNVVGKADNTEDLALCWANLHAFSDSLSHVDLAKNAREIADFAKTIEQ